jgi:hypothetical protein
MKKLSIIVVCVSIVILILGRCYPNREPRGEAVQLKDLFQIQSSGLRPGSDTSIANKRIGSNIDSYLLTKSYWDESFSTNPVYVTNLVQVSANEYSERIRVFFPNKRWGTDEWEALSQSQFEHGVEFNPEIIQILEVMRELPSVQNSSRLYTGAYATTFVINNIHEVVRDSFRIEKRYREDLNDSWVTDPNSDPNKRKMAIQLAEANYRFELAMLRERIKSFKEDHFKLLNELYGDFPLSVFQRLMAVETLDTF